MRLIAWQKKINEQIKIAVPGSQTSGQYSWASTRKHTAHCDTFMKFGTNVPHTMYINLTRGGILRINAFSLNFDKIQTDHK